MIDTILHDEEFKTILTKHAREIIEYLIENGVYFGVTARLKAVDFNPELPPSIKSRFSEYTMFQLSNYTFSSIEIDDEYLSFEAGFGEENFGSVCYIPLYAIFQIVIDESLIYLNPVATINKYIEYDEEELEEISINSFLNNPKNKKFLK